MWWCVDMWECGLMCCVVFDVVFILLVYDVNWCFVMVMFYFIGVIRWVLIIRFLVGCWKMVCCVRLCWIIGVSGFLVNCIMIRVSFLMIMSWFISLVIIFVLMILFVCMKRLKLSWKCVGCRSVVRVGWFGCRCVMWCVVVGMNLLFCVRCIWIRVCCVGFDWFV